MNLFVQLVISFCATSVFVGALYMICPDGAVSKSVKYVLSLVFILTVITACSVTVKQTDINFENFSQHEIDTSPSLVAAAKQVYSLALKNADINFKEITVCTNKASDGSIVINKIIINSDSEKEKILKALSQVAENYEVEIINE